MRTGMCKHYNGDFHNTHCKAGVCYLDVTTDPQEQRGRALRKPCVQQDERDMQPSQLEHYRRRGKCGKYEEPTAEELAAEEAEWQKRLEMHRKVGPLIIALKAEHKGKSYSGEQVCPICGGNLRVSIAGRNGHSQGKCATEGCISWIE